MSKYKELFLTTTDTVPGIGAPVSDQNKQAIFNIKGRSNDKPLIIMVGSLDQAKEFKEFNAKAREMAKKYWPGSVTLVLSEKLALRMPDNRDLQALLLEKGPCYITSANISGNSVLSFGEAKDVFQEIKQYYYFGEGSGKASKIIRVKDGKVLR